MAGPLSTSALFRTATAFEAARQAVSVQPDDADKVAETGRARFYDALAGRYGLPGSALVAPARAVMPDDSPDSLHPDSLPAAHDLRAMTTEAVRDLARRLTDAGRIDGEAGALMGLDFASLPYAADQALQRSPLSLFAGAWGQGQRTGTWDWIVQHTEQHRHLVAEGGDPRAIDGSKRVLDQLHQLQAERALYATQDRARDGRDDGERGQGWGGASLLGNPFDSLAMPSELLGLMSGR